MIEPLVRAADFQRALGTVPRARTPRFSLHHAPAAVEHAAGELSTGIATGAAVAVDDARWLGIVVPKRLARRSVTRHLVKRAVRAAVACRAALLAPGVWVVRLRAPIDAGVFRSAASDALRRSLAAELIALLDRPLGRA